MEDDLCRRVVEATGLPVETVASELRQILAAAGFTGPEFTLEQLREAVADYLQDVILDAKKEHDELFRSR